MIVLYDITFCANPRANLLHRLQHEKRIGVVHSIDDKEAFRAYHLIDGKHLRPDYAAIRQALPHYHRKAFDRAGGWWFPLTMRQAISHCIIVDNACSLTLTDRRGRLLGTIYAIPYIKEY
jgi:hypothetical protein